MVDPADLSRSNASVMRIYSQLCSLSNQASVRKPSEVHGDSKDTCTQWYFLRKFEETLQRNFQSSGIFFCVRWGTSYNEIVNIVYCYYCYHHHCYRLENRTVFQSKNACCKHLSRRAHSENASMVSPSHPHYNALKFCVKLYISTAFQMTDDKLYTSLSANTIMAELSNHI